MKNFGRWTGNDLFVQRIPQGAALSVCFLAVLTLFALVAPCKLSGQTSVHLKIDSTEQTLFWENIKGFKPQPRSQVGTNLEFPASSRDSLFTALLWHFRQKSFLLVSIDSLQDAEGSRYQILQIGVPVHWLSLHPAANFGHENWLAAAGYRARFYEGRALHYETVLKLEQDILEEAENNGYPFATVWLDSVQLRPDGAVSASLQLDSKRYFTFKGIKIKGDLKLPASYLPNYLGIKPGTPYSRARVLRLREQLRSLLFLEPTANPSVTFAGDGATVNLFLQKKRASRFDFIIGLLPQPDATNGKLLLTGSLSAAFQNALNLGERFSAELERLKPETQKVDIQASVPYVLGSPFGAEGRLGIFKRDSTWTDAQSEAGISYLFTGADFVRFFWENKSSSLQKIDTFAILTSHRLPPNLDYTQNGFGLETSFTKLDYRFNPRKGWDLTIKTVAGFNTIRRNSQIENLHDPSEPDFSFATLYDSLAQRATRFRAEIKGEVFLPVFARSTLKVEIRAGGIFSDKPVYTNEQYRLGGNKLLRGFDEESLFATRYTVATAEWRLLIGQNSFLAAFTDWGYLENRTDRIRVFLRPLGLGAGLNFETRAGIFGISAAVGRRDVGQAINFRATKFHLGYVSLF